MRGSRCEGGGGGGVDIYEIATYCTRTETTNLISRWMSHSPVYGDDKYVGNYPVSIIYFISVINGNSVTLYSVIQVRMICLITTPSVQLNWHINSFQ